MITLTREEAQSVLDALSDCREDSEELFYEYKQKYGDHYKPQRITFQQSVLDQSAQAIETLRARLSAPEPEPFGIWHQGDTYEESDFYLYKDSGDVACKTCVKLYTAPPQRKEPDPVADKYLMEIECTKCGAKQDGILTVNTPPQRKWPGLTDEEISNLWNAPGDSGNEFARAIEAKLKEKNHV